MDKFMTNSELFPKLMSYHHEFYEIIAIHALIVYIRYTPMQHRNI